MDREQWTEAELRMWEDRCRKALSWNERRLDDALNCFVDVANWDGLGDEHGNLLLEATVLTRLALLSVRKIRKEVFPNG